MSSRCILHPFLMEVMEDFEETILTHPDSKTIMNQIFYGVHYSRNYEGIYIDIGPDFYRNIRISSIDIAEIHYQNEDGSKNSYDAYEIQNEIMEMGWNSDLVSMIFDYIPVNRYSQVYELMIYDEKNEKISTYPHLFSLNDDEKYENKFPLILEGKKILSRNESHDFLFQEIMFCTSHLVKPYSNLVSYVKELIQSYDMYRVGNGRFMEVIDNVLSSFLAPKVRKDRDFPQSGKSSKDNEYISENDYYETQILCKIDLFRDRHAEIVIEERFNISIQIHQDNEGFPIHIVWNKISNVWPKTETLVAEYEEFGNGKKKPLLSYRQIKDFLHSSLFSEIDE